MYASLSDFGMDFINFKFLGFTQQAFWLLTQKQKCARIFCKCVDRGSKSSKAKKCSVNGKNTAALMCKEERKNLDEKVSSNGQISSNLSGKGNIL